MPTSHQSSPSPPHFLFHFFSFSLYKEEEEAGSRLSIIGCAAPGTRKSCEQLKLTFWRHLRAFLRDPTDGLGKAQAFADVLLEHIEKATPWSKPSPRNQKLWLQYREAHRLKCQHDLCCATKTCLQMHGFPCTVSLGIL